MTTKSLIILFGHVNGPDKKRKLDYAQLSRVAMLRCDLAVNLLSDNPDIVVLPTGAFGNHFNITEQPHWRCIRAYLINKGIDENRILHGTESSNTFQDCLCARKVILDNNYSKIVAITSDYHVARVQYILDRIFDGINYTVVGAETPSDILAIEDRDEKKSFEWLKRNWITPPLYEKGASLPEAIYEATANDQKHYDTVSLATVTGAIVLSGVLIQFATTANEFLLKTIVLWAGAFFIILLFFIYERAAASARTARRTLQSIEIGFEQRGFSANYVPEQLFTWLPSIQTTVRYLFVCMIATLVLFGILLI